jgi:ADP-ribosyl-[dinitrogen reductase] hydrolase
MRGAGPTTQAAVRRFVATGELHATEGSSIGAAMRALPFGRATPVAAAGHRRGLTGRLSRTTHGAPEAVISAGVVAELAAWAIEQHPVDAVVAAGLREAEAVASQQAVDPATLQPLRQAARGDWPSTTAGPTLDALATVGSVLQVLREAKGLAAALKRAVALGGDTDTTAAIVGGILGCQLQDVEGQIRWISRVGMADARLIEAAAAGLYELRRSSQ